MDRLSTVRLKGHDLMGKRTYHHAGGYRQEISWRTRSDRLLWTLRAYALRPGFL